MWPDRDVAAQAAQGRLVEDLADQPEVLVDDDARRRRTPRSRPPPDRGAGGRTDRSRSASRPPPPAPRHRRRHRRPEVREIWGSRSCVSRPSPRGTCREYRRRTTMPGAGGVKVATLQPGARPRRQGAVLPFVRHAGRLRGRRAACPATGPTPASSSHRPNECCANCSATRATATTTRGRRRRAPHASRRSHGPSAGASSGRTSRSRSRRAPSRRSRTSP